MQLCQSSTCDFDCLEQATDPRLVGPFPGHGCLVALDSPRLKNDQKVKIVSSLPRGINGDRFAIAGGRGFDRRNKTAQKCQVFADAQGIRQRSTFAGLQTTLTCTAIGVMLSLLTPSLERWSSMQGEATTEE
jgi:hypothetical protein